MKKDNDGMFDITMESFDGAEVCKLVGLIILNALAHKYGTNNIWLYRDDELIIFKNTTGLWAERTRKEITRHFKEHGLKITTQSNLKSVPHSTWRMDFSNHRENQTMSCFTSTQNLATHPLSSNYYLQPSITDYQPYHPTKKHSTKLSLS